MKNKIKALKFSIISFVLVSFFIACDKDFTVIDSNVLGEENSSFITDSLSFQILAYNKKLESLRINGLASNLLGVYNDPIYGLTTASVIAQITPTTDGPDFGENTKIDSVILSIPYFSRITGTDTDGNSTYTILDSLYGESATGVIDSIKLGIYQNTYFLRDFDPSSSSNTQQFYYSKSDVAMVGTENMALNGSSSINFDNFKSADSIFEVNNFIPSSNAVVTVTGRDTDSEVKTRSVPAFRTHLDTTFWNKTIIKKEGDAVLSNASNFNNYFRGLYFKAEAINNKGSLVLLNFASTNANITIYYSKDSTVATERIQATYTLKFTGNILNTFINDYSTVTLQDGNKTTGDEKLYLKGTAGSMTVVDLFPNGLEDFLNTYRIPLGNGTYKTDSNGNYILKRLINDAQLIVYEHEDMAALDKDKNGKDYSTFDRLYAYDLENNIPLVDYTYDSTNNTSDPFNSSYFHLGQRLVNESNVAKYKIHLTEHLNNILIRDSTNTKIGLVLSTNVNYTNNAKILNSTDVVTGVPAASIITPRGTVLHGTNSTEPKKKMKLKVFYTEPQ